MTNIQTPTPTQDNSDDLDLPEFLKRASTPAPEASQPREPSPASRPSSWRDILPVHPVADMLPMMTDAELVDLGEDIKKNGMTSRVMVLRDRKANQYLLLDGRNRLDALEAVGIGIEILTDRNRLDIYANVTMPQPVELDAATTDPYTFVISANLHRRHLTASQKRDLIAAILKAKAELSDRQIGKMVKADNKTVASVRADLEGREEIPHVETRKDSKGRAQPAKKAKPKATVDEQPAAHMAAYAANELGNAIQKLDSKTTPGQQVITAEQRKAAYAAEEDDKTNIAESNQFHRQMQAFLTRLEDEFPAWLAKAELDEECAASLANALNICAERLMSFRNDVLDKAAAKTRTTA